MNVLFKQRGSYENIYKGSDCDSLAISPRKCITKDLQGLDHTAKRGPIYFESNYGTSGEILKQ